MDFDLQTEFDNQSLILDQLTEMSIALSTQRDYKKLLDLILSRAMLLSRCDAGSLYILPPREEEQHRALRFVAARNDSVVLSFREAELPITTQSLAGFVAATGEAINVEDAYAIPDDAPYAFNRGFDKETGYRTKSLLVLPMTNHRGEITGVVQLINRKRDPSAILKTPAAVEEQVVPFDDAATRLMRAAGSLAAVAIDNNRLYGSIERLFEGFVKASVTAIEQRDPATSGHSLRVSVLAVGLAEEVNAAKSGTFGDITFTGEQLRELRYASLLHDFGKVGVRERVLVKGKKLYPRELERIMARLELARLYRERDCLRRKVALLGEGGSDLSRRLAELDKELHSNFDTLDRFRETIIRDNEPTVLPEGEFSALQAIAATTFVDRAGKRRPLLEPGEAGVLSIRKGSLSESERLEIESHVTHTYNFLRRIPWTSELKEIPFIAYRHHEKLNGGGYPEGAGAEEIPIQSRIMTVADIYDALSASDRSYKKALPTEKALDILRMEADGGFLQKSLVDLFIEAKVYERTADWKARGELLNRP